MGKFCANTVAGSQPGKKYDEETKTEVLTALLTASNIHKVARKFKIPESTIRGWLKEARAPGPNGEKSIWQQTREDAIRDITVKASQGALMAVENIQRRLEIDTGKIDKREQLERRYVKARREGDTETENIVSLQLNALNPMSDYVVANHLRALASVTNKADKLDADVGTMGGDVESYIAAVEGDEY